MKSVVRKYARRALCVKTLNALAIGATKLFRPFVPNTLSRKIPFVGRVRLQLPNSRELYLETDGNDRIATALYWEGIDGFETSTMRLFLRLLEHADTVLDVGAYTGIYALIAAIDNPQRKVYGFEPVPEICDRFRRNVRINGLDNVQVLSAAVTDYDGHVELCVPAGALPQDSSIQRGFRQPAEVLSVEALTIDSFVAENGVEGIGLLKIDTEAAEHKVLAGARDTIRRDRPIIICEVLPGRTEAQLHAVMDDLGYRYFWISSRGLIEKKQIAGDRTSRQWDYLFITDERIGQVFGETGPHFQRIRRAGAPATAYVSIPNSDGS